MRRCRATALTPFVQCQRVRQERVADEERAPGPDVSLTVGLRWRPLALLATGIAAAAAMGTVTIAPDGAHRELTGRQWQQIAKDPDAHAGEQIVVFGVVTQFAAGAGWLRASVDGLDGRDASDYETRALLHGDGLELRDVVKGDLFRAEVTVAGSDIPDTVFEEKPIPNLQVERIRVLERAG